MKIFGLVYWFDFKLFQFKFLDILGFFFDNLFIILQFLCEVFHHIINLVIYIFRLDIFKKLKGLEVTFSIITCQVMV